MVISIHHAYNLVEINKDEIDSIEAIENYAIYVENGHYYLAPVKHSEALNAFNYVLYKEL